MKSIRNELFARTTIFSVIVGSLRSVVLVQGFCTFQPSTTGSHSMAIKPLSTDDVNVNMNINVAPLQRTSLFGILDDLLSEEKSENDSPSTSNSNSENNKQMEDLYHKLIFSNTNDIRKVIENHLGGCTDPKFLEYLTVESEKVSVDEEEKAGLEDLVRTIEEVRLNVEKKKKQEEEEAAAAAAAVEAKKEIESQTSNPDEEEDDEGKSLTNADLLRKVSKIDAAMSVSDDEKPSDFMSDCREVVNLSRGFNDSGQMRVGGR